MGVLVRLHLDAVMVTVSGGFWYLSVPLLPELLEQLADGVVVRNGEGHLCPLALLLSLDVSNLPKDELEEKTHPERMKDPPGRHHQLHPPKGNRQQHLGLTDVGSAEVKLQVGKNRKPASAQTVFKAARMNNGMHFRARL